MITLITTMMIIMIMIIVDLLQARGEKQTVNI